MSNLFFILCAIVLLGILVIVHEAGHFWAARITGIEVMEFSVGIGPKLLSWKSRKHDTKFSVRLILMGGYCAFYGEDDVNGEHKDDPRAYNRQNVWKRMFTVIMGPLMNFVLAFVVAVGYYCLIGLPTYDPNPMIAEVEAGGPAAVAGLLPDDVVLKVNGENMRTGSLDTLLAAITGYQEGEPALRFLVLRGEEEVTLEVLPFWDTAVSRYRAGVQISSTPIMDRQADGSLKPHMTRFSLGEGIESSWYICVDASKLILNALKALVTTGEGFEDTAGPVGVVSIVSTQVRTGGLDAFLNLLVLISINLGVMNLLPIPGLDGSRFLFMLFEAIFRKPVPREKEAMVHLIGMFFLFGLMIMFTIKDVAHLFQ